MFRVRIIYQDGCQETLEHITEIHFHPPHTSGVQIAFESNYLESGKCMPLAEIKEFEAIEEKG